MFAIGQEVRLRFGSFVTASQVAKIEALKPGKVGVRRFRARSGKWNKRIEWWDEATIAREVREVQEHAERRAARTAA